MRSVWVLACVLAYASVSRAEDSKFSQARIHSQAGSAYYNEARYDEAAREFEAAYRLKPLADLQYNLAQCYERLGRPADAATAYQRYLDGSPAADDRDIVLQRMKNLQARGDTGAAPAQKVVLKTIVVYREAPPPPGRAARWAAYGAGALGLGGLAAGVAAAVLASQASHDIQAAANAGSPPAWDGKPRDAQDRLVTYQIVCGVGFGIAALGAAAFGGLYYIGGRIDREAKKQLELSASVGPGTAGVFARGRF